MNQMTLQTMVINKDPNLFGWIPLNSRTPEVEKRHQSIQSTFPKFKLGGNGYWKAKDKVCHWEPVKLLKGSHLPALYQEVGSCVGHALAKSLWYMAYIDKVIMGDREIPVMPYEPYGYAQSRVKSGILGGGDGSLASGAAQAAKEDGFLDSRIAGLPPWKDSGDTVTFSGNVDRQWGNRGAPSQYVTEGRKHLIKTIGRINSWEELVTAIQNYYPVQYGSNWGGLMRCEVKGSQYPVLMNRHADSWSHSEMMNGYWKHPELGEIIHVDNSWSATAHGNNPDDAPPGGYWISKEDAIWIIKDSNGGEMNCYSQFEGFPESDMEKAMFKIGGKK